MKAPVIAFCNHRAGVGTTTTVYHLALMLSDLGLRVFVIDRDPQGDLTALFFPEESIEALWTDPRVSLDIRASPQLLLIPSLPARNRPGSDASPEQAVRSARALNFDIVLLDLGTAPDRDALLAADHVVIPLTPDFLAVQGMIAFGRALRGPEFQRRKAGPLGYIVQNRSGRFGDPPGNWLARIPGEFQRSVLGDQESEPAKSVRDDPWCLAMLKHYPSLVSMAEEAHKPMFHLKPADGALGSHFQAAQSAREDFEKLARRIAEAVGLEIPQFSGA